MRSAYFLRILALTTLVVSLPAAAGAQGVADPDAPDSHFTAAIGLFQFELDGDGLAPMLAVRGARPIGGVLMLEGSLVAARPGQDSGTSTILVPEAQVQLGIPFPGVLPYMGLGAGASFDLRDSDAGGAQTDLSLSGSLGVRGWIGERLAIVGEFRGRGLGVDFERTSAEYTIGASWRP
ncbi:MAG: hypothetical protein WD737_07840 [Gemmatimonadota bacterium]